MAYDERGGYLGCLCDSAAGNNGNSNNGGCTLLVWDVLSGALERALEDAPALLLLYHMQRGAAAKGAATGGSGSSGAGGAVVTGEAGAVVNQHGGGVSMSTAGRARSALQGSCPTPCLALLHVHVPLLLLPTHFRTLPREDTRGGGGGGSGGGSGGAAATGAVGAAVGSVGPEEERALWLALRCFHPWGLDAAQDACVAPAPPLPSDFSNGCGGGVGAMGGDVTAVVGPVATVGMPGGAGAGGGVLTPAAHAAHGWWRRDAAFVAHHALVLAAVAHRLMAAGEATAAAGSRLLTFYAVDLPCALHGDHGGKASEGQPALGQQQQQEEEGISATTTPTLSHYVSFWQDSNAALRDAARLLFKAAVARRLPPHLASRAAWDVHVAAAASAGTAAGTASAGPADSAGVGGATLDTLTAAAACVECPPPATTVRIRSHPVPMHICLAERPVSNV